MNIQFSANKVAEEQSEYSGPDGASEKPKLVLNESASSVYLFKGECLDVMRRLIAKHPDGCFDMIFADPPYNLSNGGFTCKSGKMVSVHKGDWDQSNGPEKDYHFTLEWLDLCKKLLRPNGTIWVSGTHHVIFMVGHAMQSLEFKLLNQITWEKPNPPPNLSCRYFTHSTETLIWAAKDKKSKHIFNYEEMKLAAGGKQMKSVWGILPPSKAEKTFGKHPTQKPVALLDRCILASTNSGAFVLDPFAGSSTTGVAAIRNHRGYCGIEASGEYNKLAKERLMDEIRRITDD